MGSIRAENSEDVERQTTATDIVEIFIDSKKHSQCKVTKVPTPNIPKKSCLLTVKGCLLKNNGFDMTVCFAYYKSSRSYFLAPSREGNVFIANAPNSELDIGGPGSTQTKT